MANDRPVNPRRRRKKQSRSLWNSPVAPLTILAAILFVIILILEAVSSIPEAVPENTSEPTAGTEARMEKTATATIGATGDVLLHARVIAGGLDSETGVYNYDNIFTYFADYVSRVDYGVANMEGTLAGDNNGYDYGGYPRFNAPDAIIDAVKTAGFDMMLTANNHTYDTGIVGFERTQEAIEDRGLKHIGTRQNGEEPNFLVENVGGIQVGMTCYTYETGKNSSGNKTLNGISLSADASALINTFDYQDLDTFYRTMETDIAAMKAAGAECIVLFIHWGDEYKTSPNSTQTAMAQALCELGVDVIVGGHAHVIQPVELLTSESGHTTLCLYSLGNAVSNIRIEDGYGAHTEDGMLFTFTLAKYSDGTVLVESADVLPTWVNRYTSDETGREVFAILPLDEAVDWQSAYGLSDSALAEAEQSLQRTRAIIDEGLADANKLLAREQAQIETALGIH